MLVNKPGNIPLRIYSIFESKGRVYASLNTNVRKLNFIVMLNLLMKFNLNFNAYHVALK